MPIVEKYAKTHEYTEGLELTKTNCSEWNICGGLSAKIGASAKIGYTKRQTEIVKKIEGSVQKQDITKTLSIPAESSVTVALAQKFQRKECKVKNVKLIFPKNAKIDVKVHGALFNKSLYIRDVLKDYIEDEEADPLTARLEGKYVWVETSVFLDISDPKPLDMQIKEKNST